MAIAFSEVQRVLLVLLLRMTFVSPSSVTCHTPLSITHGAYGTSDVTFEDCTVHGDWGGDPDLFQPLTYRPRWWHTALRIKTDRMTNGTVQNVLYKNIRAIGIDLLFDIQSWYPCQNQSGTANYNTCIYIYNDLYCEHPISNPCGSS